MEAQQCVELTSTNRPFGLIIVFLSDTSVSDREEEASFDVVSLHLNIDLPVVLARRIHPIPYRTRKLSSSAPMVLPLCVGGRVGRRRIKLETPKGNLGGFHFSTGYRRLQSVSTVGEVAYATSNRP